MCALLTLARVQPALRTRTFLDYISGQYAAVLGDAVPFRRRAHGPSGGAAEKADAAMAALDTELSDVLHRLFAMYCHVGGALSALPMTCMLPRCSCGGRGEG